jgi:hypothetical protein
MTTMTADAIAERIAQSIEPQRGTIVPVDTVGSFIGVEDRESMQICKILRSIEGNVALGSRGIELQRVAFHHPPTNDSPFPVLFFKHKVTP